MLELYILRQVILQWVMFSLLHPVTFMTDMARSGWATFYALLASYAKLYAVPCMKLFISLILHHSCCQFGDYSWYW